jgi:hypothetical protein
LVRIGRGGRFGKGLRGAIPPGANLAGGARAPISRSWNNSASLTFLVVTLVRRTRPIAIGGKSISVPLKSTREVLLMRRPYPIGTFPAGLRGETQHQQGLEQLPPHRHWADKRLTGQLRPRLRASFPLPAADADEQIGNLLKRLAAKLQEEPPK